MYVCGILLLMRLAAYAAPQEHQPRSLRRSGSATAYPAEDACLRSADRGQWSEAPASALHWMLLSSEHGVGDKLFRDLVQRGCNLG